MTSTHNYGHRLRPTTSESLTTVEKSGYDSPAKIEYTVDRDTSAASAITLTGRPSTARASESLPATDCAAAAAAGASAASAPPANSPDASQVLGAGAFRLVTEPSLSHDAEWDVGATHVLPNVRIIGHNGAAMSHPTFPVHVPTTAHASAVLEGLRGTFVPARRASSFAAEIVVPSRGQRRQAYLTLELLPAALANEDRLRCLNAVLAGSDRKIGRADRSRVLANLVDVVAQLSPSTHVRHSLLNEALESLTPKERDLQPSNDAPRVLVTDPAGRAFFIETHPARKILGTEDAWMNGRLAGHFALGCHVHGFCGVAIFTVRSRRPVHVAALDRRHDLGACGDCAEVSK